MKELRMLPFLPKMYHVRRVCIVILSVIAIPVILLMIGISWKVVFFLCWMVLGVSIFVPNPLTGRLMSYVLRYPIAIIFAPTITGKDPTKRDDYVVKDVSAAEFMKFMQSFPVVSFYTDENLLFAEAKQRLGQSVTVNRLGEGRFQTTAVFAYAVMIFRPDPSFKEGTPAEYLANTTISYQIWMGKYMSLLSIRETIPVESAVTADGADT